MAHTRAPAQIFWEPSPQRRESAALTRYVRWLDERRGLRFADYDELRPWSVTDLEGFWSSTTAPAARSDGTPGSSTAAPSPTAT
jgi:hypothetical protein